MDHYLDIHLRPDPEFAPAMLLNALYAKLHRVLVAQQRGDIGVSFPGYSATAYKRSLGTTLRLHGTADALASLMQQPWTTGMADHIAIQPITPVPAHAGLIQVQRVQAKSNPERERRRLIRRQGISEQEAQQRLPDSKAQQLPYPFATLGSSSTGQRFPLFIRQQAVTEARAGGFNSYGLSNSATLPAF